MPDELIHYTYSGMYDDGTKFSGYYNVRFHNNIGYIVNTPANYPPSISQTPGDERSATYTFSIPDDVGRFQITYNGQIAKTFTGSNTINGDRNIEPGAVLTETLSRACYCEGTRLLTDRGWTEVQELKVGVYLKTLSGESKRIRWIGYRHLDISRHPDPETVWPVRVSAGAIGDGVPARDLWISPGHCIFLEDVLIPVQALVNGASVVQVPVAKTTYWHVELESHSLILAEGLPAESYLDTGNRAAFENGLDVLNLHPTFKPSEGVNGEPLKCAPVQNSGPEVRSARSRLAARLPDLGYATTAAHDLHVLANGRRIDPVTLGPKRLAFILPPELPEITLISRTFIPWHSDPKSRDERLLGASVRRLQINGEEIDLRGTLLGHGWHSAEERSTHVQRWTNGKTPLPAKSRLVIIDLAGDGRYWVDRREYRDKIVA